MSVIMMSDFNVSSLRERPSVFEQQPMTVKLRRLVKSTCLKQRFSRNYYRNKRRQRRKLRELGSGDGRHLKPHEPLIKKGITGSSGGGCGGCSGLTTGPVNIPRCPPPFMPKVQRYCDAVAGVSEVSPELIGEIIRDLHCVFEKTYGKKNKMEANYRNLATEVEELKDDLACCECCKEELENELIKLHPELKALQFALEEEIQRRACLENINMQLRAQLARADAMLDADCRDKAAMQGRIKDLEAQLSKLEDAIYSLQSDKDDLLRTLQQLQEYRSRNDENSSQCAQRMSQLEEALAKCCKANEEFQKELVNVAKERDCLIAALEACENDKRLALEEFERQRCQWLEEREKLEQMISDLRKAVECLTAQNQEICDKMREVVSAHHREMDTLRKEAEKYKRMYEKEQKDRQKAEEALRKLQDELRKLQEELRRKVAECEQKELERRNDNNGGGGGGGQSQSNPCAEILARINNNRRGGCGGGGSSSGNGGSNGGGGNTSGGGGGNNPGGGGGNTSVGSGGNTSGSSAGSTNGGGPNRGNENGTVGSQGRGSTGANAGTAPTTGTSESRSTELEKVVTLESELKHSKNQVLEQEETIQSLEFEIERLRAKLELENIPVEDFSDRVQELEKELAGLQESLEEEQRKREDTEEELVAVKDELVAVKEDLAELQKTNEDSILNSQKNSENVMEVEQLKEKLRASEETRLHNEEKIIQLEDEMKNLKEHLSHESAQKHKLEQELEASLNKIQTLQQAVEFEQKSRQEIQKALDDSEQRLLLDREIKAKEQLKLQHVDMDRSNNNNDNLEQNKTELEEMRRKLAQSETDKLHSEQLLKQLQTAYSEKIVALQTKTNDDDNQHKYQILQQRLSLAEKNKAELYELRKQMEDTERHKVEQVEELRNMLQVANEKRAEMDHVRQLAQEENIELKSSHKRLKLSTEGLKCEMEQLRVQLRDALAKAHLVDELQNGLKTAETEIKVLCQKLSQAESQVVEREALRQELALVQKQKAAIEDHLNDFKDKLTLMESKLDELSDQRRQIEERLSVVVEENQRLKKIAEEHRVAHDIAQRELRDIHNMWETEVKAKGILAEKIAKYERLTSQADSRARQEADFIDKIRDKARQFKAELKAEREQSNKLKQKVDLLKEQLRTARDQLQELANDPRAQKLAEHLEKQKLEHARVLHQIGKERETLMAEFYRLGQEKLGLEKDLKELRGQIAKDNSNDKKMIDKLIATKERLEAEMLSIKTLVNKRYVEKSVMDAMRKDHEANMSALKSKLETQAEQDLTQKLSQIGAMLDNQSRDRLMIDNIRNANETSIRTEFTAMVKNMKHDTERLNGLLQARQEEITTLRSCLSRFKDKVATETCEKKELMRKLQLLSASQESLTDK